MNSSFGMSVATSPVQPQAAAAFSEPLMTSTGDNTGADKKQDWLLEWQLEKAMLSIRWWSMITAVVFTAAFFQLFGAMCLRLAWRHPAVLSVTLLLLFFMRQSLNRYLYVTWSCVVIGINVFRTRLMVRGRSEAGDIAMWEMCHRVNARFIFDAVVSLSGFWVKLAQLASVNSAFPEAFSVELSKLQDAMPPAPIPEVQATLREELGPEWADIVQIDPGPPLGSATIAQVHRAKLRVQRKDGGTEVVDGAIKIQRREVKRQFDIDIYATRLLGFALKWLIPHLSDDFSSILNDVADLSRSEMDFRIEAESQEMARAFVQSAGLNAIVPEVYQSLVTRRILGMQFVDGVRLMEHSATASGSADRRRIASDLLDFYAETMHGPIFNCDPHPGNLLVDRATGRLVVLDWGQARRLEPHERTAFAKLFLAILSQDTHVLIEACETIGFKFAGKGGEAGCEPFIILQALRFILRDSSSIEGSRAEFRQLEENFSQLKGEFAQIQVGGSKMVKGALLPLSKTADMLHQVSCRLAVSLPLLQRIASHGYKCLLEDLGRRRPPAISLRFSPSGAFVLTSERSTAIQASPQGLAGELQAILDQSHANGELLGAQLAVLDLGTGEVLADLAIGHTSMLEPAPVTPDTPFNIVELSKVFLAFAVLRLVERGDMSLDSVVVEANEDGIGPVRLENVLSHASGIFETIPRQVKSFGEFCDFVRMAERMGDADPLLPPGSRQQYHHCTFGWLVSRACILAGYDLRSAWAEFVEAALGPGRTRELTLERPSARRVAEASHELKNPGLEDMAEGLEQFGEFIGIIKRAERKDASASERADFDTWGSAFGKEQWCEAGALRVEPARSAIMPGIQAFATARVCAEALRAVATGAVVTPRMVAEARRSRRPPKGPNSEPCRLIEKWRHFERAEWGLGVELVHSDGIRHTVSSEPTPATSAKKDALAWGHTSMSGSFALVVPGEKPMVMSLLLNREGDARVAERVLSALAKRTSRSAH